MSRMVAVSGGGGFIAGHLIRRLLDEGFSVRTSDIKPFEEWHQIHPDAVNVERSDLSVRENCAELLDGAKDCYHLAADMGGMFFLGTHRVDTLNSVLITGNIFREAGGLERLLYNSSACVYRDDLQQETEVSLREDDAWPANPEPCYGLDKLYGEEYCKWAHLESGLETRVARLHNVFGPHGTWTGGREKAPAAICRKVAEAVVLGGDSIVIGGDGQQTRSFLYVDECVEGTRRIMESDYGGPLNLGSDESISIEGLALMVEDIAGVELNHIYDLEAPVGVRGRNSDNTLIKETVGWAPSSDLRSGMERTYEWVLEQVRLTRG